MASHLKSVALLTVCIVIHGMPETDLRSLLSLEPNQELIDHLGTRYEIVYPHQIRKDWARGLSTVLTSINGTVTHIQETTLLIETLEYKLQLHLELNSQLFPPTLIQLLYTKDAFPSTLYKLPENCFYHATVKNYPGAEAAFQTCNGIRGVLYLEKRIFFIHPLHGNYSVKPPHILFHYFPEEGLTCGNPEQDDVEKEEKEFSEENALWQRKKYVEIALVLDQSLLQFFKSPPTDALSTALEMVNHVDLLYRRLKTSVSLVYLELWTEDPMSVAGGNLSDVLERFREYADRKISRISVDATHLLTGASFYPESSGVAFQDSICTSNAVGITRMLNPWKPHVTAFVLAHMLGHNLGMGHDPSGCQCGEESNCIMNGNPLTVNATDFSSCSEDHYRRTLHKGYGACLYNMPTMRMSICGNNVLEENEQCDCGTAEECAETNPCCDPTTCRLVQHAQCSSGPCCKKCKLLSPDHLCRPSKGECDIPEFCSGDNGECPPDLFKKNGAVCSEGLGYCYKGTCPVLKKQCEDIWGKDAGVADSICFERLNVQGTPNGNCGRDERGGITKCTEENSYCGFLQCSQGEKTPLSLDKPPIHFVVHKINFQGTVYECKARTFSDADFEEGLVKEGTKCGYQRLCINQTCTSLKSLVSGKCPDDCSNHGICTNVNSCFCDEGWKGRNCSLVDEDMARDVYYEWVEGEVYDNAYHGTGESEMRVNPNLAITVTAASIVIGVGLVAIIVLLFFYRQRKAGVGSLCHFGSYRCKTKHQDL